jgi:hypothetical protein
MSYKVWRDLLLGLFIVFSFYSQSHRATALSVEWFHYKHVPN